MPQQTTHSVNRYLHRSLLATSPRSLIALFLVFLFFNAQVDANTLVATLPGDFSVGSTGAAQYSIPIEIPEGTAGVQPQLTINYNSQAGNGLLGVGWSIGGLSSITRCPATLAKDGFIDGVDFDSNDRFCLDGQPLVAIKGAYGAHGSEYRTEIDSFAKIIAYDPDHRHGPDHFIVHTKAGETMAYGNTHDSRFNPPNAEGHRRWEALSWGLTKVSDTLGNYFTLHYLEDGRIGEHHLTRIKYTGNTNTGLTPYKSSHVLSNLLANKDDTFI